MRLQRYGENVYLLSNCFLKLYVIARSVRCVWDAPGSFTGLFDRIGTTVLYVGTGVDDVGS